MKKGRLLVLAASMLIGLTMTAGGCVENDVTYGEWEITNQPTMTASGTARRVTEDGKKTEEVAIPALTDELWARVSFTEATHTQKGSAVYESEYGKVTITIAEKGHDYHGGKIMLTVAPDFTKGGEAKVVCAGNDAEITIALPAISTAAYSVTMPTHVDGGVAVYESEYGEIEIPLAATGHNYENATYEIIEMPTLYAKGKAIEYCVDYESEPDGKKGSRDVEVPALTDAIWQVEVVEATHTADGKSTYTSKYGVVEIVTKATGHDYKNATYEMTQAPTLTTTGKAIEYCADYEEEAEGEKGSREVTVPALTDSVWEVEVVEATHAKDGKRTYTSMYGVVETVIKAMGHNYSAAKYEITQAPTLTEKGKATEYCADYENEPEGEKGSREIAIPALTDIIWEKTTVAATHAKDGKEVYTSKYGVVEIVIEALGHNYENSTYKITQAPTKTAAGKATEYCANYANEPEGEKGSREIEIPALTDESVWQAAITAATHAKDGSEVYTSKYGVVEIVIEALGHDYENATYVITEKPSLTEKGKATEYCVDYEEEADGEKGSREIEIPALTDTSVWQVETTAATHTKDGKSVYTSKYGVVEIVIEALGHDYENATYVITEKPTLTEKGKATEYCADYEEEADGEKGSREIEIPALTDKIWKVDEATATHTKPGSVTYTSKYGVVKTEVESLGHDYENATYVITEKPTLTEKGKATEYCADYEEEADGEKGSREIDVPALTDTSVWQVETTAATHTKDGKSVYTSKYGVVEIEHKAKGHDYFTAPTYTMTVAPTLTGAGLAIEYCTDYETEEEKGSREVSVPALSNANVWSKETVPADYQNGSVDTYTSKYGEVVIKNNDRLLYPYEGKTYYSLTIDASPEDVSVGYVEGAPEVWAWVNTPTIFNSNGMGVGQAFPFVVGDQYRLSEYDMETGRVTIKIIPRTKKTYVDANGETQETYEYLEENATFGYGYVDATTGLMVRSVYDGYNYLAVSVTDAEVKASDFKAYAWNGVIVFEYTHDEQSMLVAAMNNNVYFGITMTDAAGDAIAIGDCATAENVYLKDANGIVLGAYGYNGEKMVELDGLQGAYVLDGKQVVLTGWGGVKQEGALVAKYAIIEGNKLGVTYPGATEYYEYTLSVEDMTITANKPMVTVEYNLGGVTISNADEFAACVATANGYSNANVNKNAVVSYPQPKADGKIFLGWKTASGEMVESGEIITADVSLTAEWRNLIVLYYVDNDGVTQTINAAEGTPIGDYLPVYEGSFDSETLKYYEFAGWNVDGNDIPTDTLVDGDAAGLTLTISWAEIAGYVGTYNGVEIWNAGYGNSSSKTLTITAEGKMSGVKSGVIVSYDPVTGRITWKSSASDTTEKYFWFDVRSGVIAGIYKDKHIANDLYVFGRSDYQTTGKMAATYGVYCPTNKTWEAQFIRVNTRNGLTDIFTYEDRIYSNISITDAAGNALAIADIKNSKTVMVTDLDTGKIIFKAASTEANFGKGNASGKVIILDEYNGTYACGEDTVVLDGAGGIEYAGKTGTYTAVQGKDYGFDVYLENSTEYWRLTLSGDTATMVKPMVTISYNLRGREISEEDAALVQDYQANVNIKLTLPKLSSLNDYVFRGWYLDALNNEKAEEEYTPKTDITLYADWQIKYTVSVNENNDVEPYVQEYGARESVVVENPVYKGYKFLGWYTTADFREGTEWTSGYEITKSVTVYAKWTEAPKYNNNYTAIEYDGKEKSDGAKNPYAWSSAVLKVDPYGDAPSTGYPFGGSSKYTVTEGADYEQTGALVIANSSNHYKGYINKETGIIVITCDSGVNAKFGEVMLLTPYPTDKFHAENQAVQSYWNSGDTRVLTYTYDGTKHGVFINENTVYFNATFTDESGAEVAANTAYRAETLYVYVEGELIAKFGFDGTTMKALDGYEGAYKKAGEETATMSLNGIDGITLDGVKGTYSLSEGTEYNVEAYVGGCYYRITADKETYTYAAVMPMVSVAYDLSGITPIESAPETASKNVNISYALPVLTAEQYVFRGWFVSGSEDVLYTSTYTPTVDVTLIAKWDEKVTLTVIYGNDIGDQELVYGVGDTIAPQIPPATNGKTFGGWYLDNAFTTPLASTVITENTTIYCKWLDGVAYKGSYKGNFNAYGSSNNGTLRYFSTKNLEVDLEGNVTGEKTGKITDYDAATGMFKLESGTYNYVGCYDEASGVLVYNYGSGGESLKSDVNVFIKGSASLSATASNDQYVWNGGLSRLIHVKVTMAGSGEVKDMCIFIDGNSVRGNVTWEGDEGITNVGALKNSTKLVIKSASGEVLYTK